MEDGYKVSIITVCMNSANTIEQTILSVLNQTYKDIEYIIIDGGSTDGTQDIIQRYRGQIAYYSSEKDSGIYNAMNKGIQHANGEIVGILNSDDWYADNAVETAVEKLRMRSCHMVHGRLMIVYPDGRMRLQKERSFSDIYKCMVVNHPTVFVRREIYQDYGNFDESYKSAADYELILRWYLHGIRMQYVPEILVNFRKGGYSEYGLELSVAETYNISKKYVDKFPEEKRENYLINIEEKKENSEKTVRVYKKLRGIGSGEKAKLQKWIRGDRDIIVFGTGDYGFWCYDMFSLLGIRITAWIDNDVGKQGTMILGIPVAGVEAIDCSRHRIVIGTKDHYSEIVQQLTDMGIGRDSYLLVSDLEWMLAGE